MWLFFKTNTWHALRLNDIADFYELDLLRINHAHFRQRNSSGISDALHVESSGTLCRDNVSQCISVQQVIVERAVFLRFER